MNQCADAPEAEYPFRGSRAFKTWVALGVACLLVVVAAPVGVALLLYAFLRRASVAVYPHGLAVRRGRREEFCHWDEVESVRAEPRATWAAVYHSFTVRRSDGREWTFDENYRNVAELGATICARTGRPALPGESP